MQNSVAGNCEIEPTLFDVGETYWLQSNTETSDINLTAAGYFCKAKAAKIP
jgi:hypothetical protein